MVIGGGPAGLSAAQSACLKGGKVAIIEREARLGGILKQCVHDGFGLIRFGEKLAGPEYSERYIDFVKELDIDTFTFTFVTRIEKKDGGFEITAVSKDGIEKFFAKALVLATGCRERTAKQVLIQGTRPAGATVEGVYEVKPTPSGLTRNIHQCLHDFNIPLHLSHTVTRVFGTDRLEAVEVAKVDDKMQPVDGTQRRIDCDALILSVGLIPENELAESIGVKINPFTKGADCDQTYMSSIDGVFSAGNALNVFDLVDYVSECAKDAGANAVDFKPSGKSVRIEKGKGLLSYVPHRIDLGKPCDKVVFFFRAAKDMDKATLYVSVDGNEAFKKNFAFLRPPEMQRIELDFSSFGIKEGSKVEVRVEER